MSVSLLFRYGDNLIEGAASVVNNAKKANPYVKIEGENRFFVGKLRGKSIFVPAKKIKQVLNIERKDPGAVSVRNIAKKTGVTVEGVQAIFKNVGFDSSVAGRQAARVASGNYIKLTNPQVDITTVLKKDYDKIKELSLKFPKLGARQIGKKANVSEKITREVMRDTGQILPASTIGQKAARNKTLTDMANYILKNQNKLSTSPKENTGFLIDLTKKFNFNSQATLSEYLNDLKTATGKYGRIKLPEGLTLRTLKKIPIRTFTLQTLGSAKYSPKTVNFMEDLGRAIKSISANQNFEHTLAKAFVGKHLPRSFLLKGEHTSRELNMFKAHYDKELLRLANDKINGKISNASFNKQVDKLRDLITATTGGYKPGKIKFDADGSVIPIDAGRRVLDRINDVGPRAAGIYTFMKNADHNRVLRQNYLAWKSGKIKGNEELDKAFNAFEKLVGPEQLNSFTSVGSMKLDKEISRNYKAFGNLTMDNLNTQYMLNPDNVLFKAMGYGQKGKGYTSFDNLERVAKLKDGGRVGMDSGGLSLNPEDIQKEIDRALEEDGEILSEKEAINNIVQLRLGFDEGGRVGMQIGGATPKSTGTLGGGGGTGTIGGGPTNKIGTIQSILSGIGAGIIDIPRGAFTLGAALMDLGLGTNKAAKVEQWFDDLTEFDETAEQSTLASLVRTLTNLGIPGAAAWKMGTQVTKKALLAKRNGNYFRITDPKLEERMKTALNAKGRIAATLGGAAGAGVSDAIFVGDPETVGTMGDMFGGGPTELTPNDSTEASREVMNRIKFGLDGALFLGVIGGTGSSIKSAIARRNDLSSTNSTLDKFLSKLRPRGAKPQEFFDLERRNIGLRAGDVNYAGEVARKLDKHIDAIFPFVKNPFNKMGNKGRAEFMDELNETLLSGRIEMDVTGKSAFGEMDPERVRKIIKMMRDRGAKQKDIDGVLDSFEQMRLGWAHMFSRLGYSMADADPKVLEEFKGIIGDKFKSYLGSTYEIFQNKSLIPLLNYAPTEEAVNKAVKLVQDSARTAGKTINDEEARHFVDKMVESARLPRGLATSKEKTSGIYLEVPDFFANKTVLSDLEFNPKISLDSLTPDARKVIDEVLGKVKDPMQTMLAGSGRLSLITRRNQFYEELMKKSKDNIAAKEKGFFYDTELDAFNALGGNIKKIEIDPTRTIEAGITNPLNGKYAERGVAEAIEESAMLARDKGTVRQMYDSLILYPKATSQIAKTILSPITHVRNFVSAGAFAGANGLLPGLVSPDDMAAAFKDAYKALQIPGARMANDQYRELLRLGVVNSNVRLGDLQRLLQDVNFGETLTAQKGLRGLIRPLSKAKKWTEEMYTAEDDFWKISSYALERQRLSRAYGKYGIKVNDELLNEEAASIVRNNIPNYDMVNDFIKGLRQLPFGNFVSFPAEIMRTSTNILGRALKEIRYEHKLADGRIVNPLKDIGYKRLFGFGTTVVAVPYGTVEAAKAIYDVTEDEMKAMRRFVPGWSKNSTLVPIRDTETGELKYVDFSHANAYDTMIRPINTMINSVGKGIDEGEIMKNIALGMFDATKETVSPFISESIWFEGASDIFLRGGRTREGRRLWTEATPWGEKVSLTVGHLVKTQMPGSIPALNRMGLAIREEVDEYGRTYEFGDELAGIFGFRAVKVDPIRSMKFKIADFRTGINAARREFTSPLLRGGVVDPADVVDRFEIANEAAYKVQQDMFKDYYGARTLGVNTAQLDLQFADRVSGTQLNAIKAGKFKPFIPSDNIKKAFADNARAIGAPNGYLAAERQIQSMIRQYNNLPLFGDLLFPKIENPFIGNTTLPNAAVEGIQPVAAVSGMQGGITAGGLNNPNLTALKGQRVFGSTDPIFGVG